MSENFLGPRPQHEGVDLIRGDDLASSTATGLMSAQDKSATDTWKRPVAFAHSANVASLSGTTASLDSSTIAVGDRVLLLSQTTASQNGIWVVQSGAWTRPPDFDSSEDVFTGIQIPVQRGAGYANTVWTLSTTGTITVDTTNLTFTLTVLPRAFATDALPLASVVRYLTPSAAAAIVFYKRPVRVASTANIDLTTGGLLTIDGITLVAGDRVLVKDQTTTSQNGIYQVASGAWARTSDADNTNELVTGTSVLVLNGATHGAQLWYISTTGTITIGTTGIAWVQWSPPADLTAHLAATDPHPGYLTPDEGNALYLEQDASGGAALNYLKFDRQAAAPATPGTAGANIYTYNADGNTVLEGTTETGGRFRFLRDQLFIGRNNTGATIPKGSLVRITGWDATAEVVTVALASNDALSTMYAQGMVSADIPNGTSGRCWQIGLVTNLNTSALTVGSPVYLGTNGGFTSTAPSAPNYEQVIGEVLTVDAAAGRVFLSIASAFRQVVASGGGGPTPWWLAQSGANAIFGANGNGDPVRMANELDVQAVAAPTPAGITATIVRAVKFRLPVALTLSQLSLYGVGAVATGYIFGILPVTPGGARLWTSGAVTSAANAWLNIAVSPTVVLAANTDYWFCVSNNNNGGAVAGFRSPPPPISAAQFGAAAAPLGGRSLGFAEFVQFATTAGAMPATTPAVASAAYASGTTGSVPIAFLIGTV